MIDNFNERVKEIHSCLDSHRIPHAFGGAIALIYAVREPRLTHDIDLNISVDTDHVSQVFTALPITLPHSESDAKTVKKTGQVRLFWGPNLPVDLFFPRHEFHDHVAARTRLVSFDGQPLPVISPTDLTVFKTMYNRRKDWADIEAMLGAKTVDHQDALRWVSKILGNDHQLLARLKELMAEIDDKPESTSSGDPNVWHK